MLFVCVTHHKVQGVLPSAVDKLLPLVELVSHFRPIIQQFWEDVEDSYLLPTWARKITCRRFNLNAPSEEVWTNTAIYSHYTTEDTHHWRSKVSEDCSSLPTSSSQQTSNHWLPVLHLGWSALLWVSYGYTEPPSPTALVLYHGQVLWSPPCNWIGWCFSYAWSATANFFVIPLSQVSRYSFSLIGYLGLPPYVKVFLKTTPDIQDIWSCPWCLGQPGTSKVVPDMVCESIISPRSEKSHLS